MSDAAARTQFVLHARLHADTFMVTDLPLSRVLLMNDARFAWLVLVPRRAGLSELSDLDAAAQAIVLQEVNQAAAALRNLGSCDKINIGALGNIVNQLHVHVVARHRGDPAWPGPVWGHGKPEPYPAQLGRDRCEHLRNALTALFTRASI